MRYVLMVNNGYMSLVYKEVAKVKQPMIEIVHDINNASVFTQEQIQAVGQDLYQYAKELHNTLVKVIIVL